MARIRENGHSAATRYKVSRCHAFHYSVIYSLMVLSPGKTDAK
jgi:hypothetical protein